MADCPTYLETIGKTPMVKLSNILTEEMKAAGTTVSELARPAAHFPNSQLLRLRSYIH